MLLNFLKKQRNGEGRIKNTRVFTVIVLSVSLCFAALLIAALFIHDDGSRETPSERGAGNADMANRDEEAGEADETGGAEEPESIDIAVAENRKGETVFSLSIDDYINCYNGYYRRDNSKDYLTHSKDWRFWMENSSVRSAYETRFYRFKEDESIWTLPTVDVCAPTNADYIQEIDVNYDWHGYSEPTYKMYEEMCFYTLKVFFRDLPDERVRELCSEINYLGYEHDFPYEERYSSDSVPYAVFYRDNVAVYSYFAIGSLQHFCVIPSTQEIIDDFKNKGAEMHEII